RRCELEAQLGQFRQELENAQKQLEAQQEGSIGEQSTLVARIQELLAMQAEVEQQVNSLTEAFAEETKRREAAEQQAGEIGERRSELEAQLAERQQAQARLQHELEESQNHLRVQQEGTLAEQTKFGARIKELQVTQVEVEQQVKRLTEALAEETKRRESAERQAGEMGQQRGEVEARLAEDQQAQAGLQEEVGAP